MVMPIGMGHSESGVSGSRGRLAIQLAFSLNASCGGDVLNSFPVDASGAVVAIGKVPSRLPFKLDSRLPRHLSAERMTTKQRDISQHFPQKKGPQNLGKRKDQFSKSSTAVVQERRVDAPILATAPLQNEIDDTECKLRRWDMDMKFGPCIGIPRMRRWERAEKLGLNPPTEIRNLLLTANASEDCLWQHRV